MLHTPPGKIKIETTQSNSQLASLSRQEHRPFLTDIESQYKLSGGTGNTPSSHAPGVQQHRAAARWQSTYGNQAVLRTLHASPQIARMTPLRPSQGIILQRKCACGGTPEAEGECAECKAKHEGTLQRRAANAVSPAVTNGVPPIVHNVLHSPGQPLDTGIRAFMEPRFGYDFSQVRVHTDARAAESARAVNALAYTVGRNVVFGAGQYSPTTASGRRLLAHELTHSVQQGFAPNPLPQLIGDPDSALERQADEAADGVVKNVPPPGTGNTISIASTVQTTLLQRDEGEETSTRSSWVEHEMICEKKPLVESWGQDTCCSRLGFIDNEAVDKKTGEKKSSCNKWPLFLALHAKEHGLQGVASCRPSELGHTAQIKKAGGKSFTVGCIDARDIEKNVIEIDAEAAQDFFGSKSLFEHADEVCYGDSFTTCKFETSCRPRPKETWCLPVGVTKEETDSPAKHGWHKQ